MGRNSILEDFYNVWLNSQYYQYLPYQWTPFYFPVPYESGEDVSHSHVRSNDDSLFMNNVMDFSVIDGLCHQQRLISSEPGCSCGNTLLDDLNAEEELAEGFGTTIEFTTPPVCSLVSEASTSCNGTEQLEILCPLFGDSVDTRVAEQRKNLVSRYIREAIYQRISAACCFDDTTRLRVCNDATAVECEVSPAQQEGGGSNSPAQQDGGGRKLYDAKTQALIDCNASNRTSYQAFHNSITKLSEKVNKNAELKKIFARDVHHLCGELADIPYKFEIPHSFDQANHAFDLVQKTRNSIVRVGKAVCVLECAIRWWTDDTQPGLCKANADAIRKNYGISCHIGASICSEASICEPSECMTACPAAPPAPDNQRAELHTCYRIPRVCGACSSEYYDKQAVNVLSKHAVLLPNQASQTHGQPKEVNITVNVVNEQAVKVLSKHAVLLPSQASQMHRQPQEANGKKMYADGAKQIAFFHSVCRDYIMLAFEFRVGSTLGSFAEYLFDPEFLTIVRVRLNSSPHFR